VNWIEIHQSLVKTFLHIGFSATAEALSTERMTVFRYSTVVLAMNRREDSLAFKEIPFLSVVSSYVLKEEKGSIRIFIRKCCCH